jgi:vanillin dehydrogenase
MTGSRATFAAKAAAEAGWIFGGAIAGHLVSEFAKVRNHEEALELANATDYGLSSGVITNDMQKALDLAFGLDAGMVHLNDCTVSDEPHVPFGGVKNSGYGREGGRFSMEEMTELKWITVQRGQRAFPI